MTALRPASLRRRPWPLVIPFAAVALLLASCGGGNGGGGGGGGDISIKLAVVNKTAADVNVSLDTTEPGEPTVVASCKASLVTMPLPAEDWTVVIDGNVAIDSLELEPDLIDVDLIGEMIVNEDGTFEQKELRAGRVKQQPANLGVCN